MKLENNSYNYEKILSELKDDLFKNISNHYSGSIQLSESDPLLKILEVSSYRELLIRQKIQDTYHASLLSQAKGNDLKKLSRFFFDEDEINNILNDNEIREKIDNLWKNDTYYTTGTRSAYEFYAYQFVPDAKDVFINVEDDQIIIYLLLNNNKDKESDILRKTEQKLNDPSIRRLTDKIIVKPAKVIEYNLQITISATLYAYSNLTADIIKKNVREKAEKLFLISKNIPIIELIKSAYQPGIISYKTQVDYQSDQKVIQIDKDEIIVKIGEAFKLNNIKILINYQDK